MVRGEVAKRRDPLASDPGHDEPEHERQGEAVEQGRAKEGVPHRPARPLYFSADLGGSDTEPDDEEHPWQHQQGAAEVEAAGGRGEAELLRLGHDLVIRDSAALSGDEAVPRALQTV